MANPHAKSGKGASAGTPRNPKTTLRRSALLGMAGPGALIDLPKVSIIMAGLDHWRGHGVSLDEPRLSELVRRMNDGQAIGLKVPPTPMDDTDLQGVAAFEFPEWFVSQRPDEAALRDGLRARKLVNRAQYDNLKKRERDAYVPMRFVAACPNGHLQDVVWNRVVHGTKEGCGAVDLSLVEQGAAGDLADVSVRCGRCKKAVTLANLVTRSDDEAQESLGTCEGQMPWLGSAAQEKCDNQDAERPGPHRLRLLVRHASNAYFPTSLRIITIPPPKGDDIESLVKRLRAAPDLVRETIVDWDLGTLKLMRPKLKAMFEAFGAVSDEALFEAKTRLVEGGPAKVAAQSPYPKDDELAAFYAVGEALHKQSGDRDFSAYAYPLERLPDVVARVAGGELRVRDFLERVVLVERLREVQALVGFMRLEPPPEIIRSEYDINPRMAKITRNERWRPAIELRGEGVFVGLDAAAVETWLGRKAVGAHIERVREELEHSRYGKNNASLLTTERVTETELPYILVHTLAHLVLIAVALECGYSASSIRERIYIGQVDGVRRYGFLLYTGTADSEGTLGGLVEVGRAITRHLAAGLEYGALCSNDPICAEARHPVAAGGHIHGAACHGCVLTAESSCERRNELLDRRLVVETVSAAAGSGAGLAFFGPR